MSDEIYLYTRNNSKNAPVKLCFAYPAIESFALASLGFLSLFKSLDINPDVYAEKLFTDSKNIETPANKLDAIAFSMSFEIDFLGVFKILDKYNLPYLAKEREENSPILIAGGPVMSSNPEPYCEFFDVIMLGDGENQFDIIVDVLKNNSNLSKKEKLKLLSKYDGFYIPSLTKYDSEKRLVSTLDNKNFSVKKAFFNLKNCVHTTILSEKSYFKDTFIIEVERGCPQRCGFCLASYINYPVRFLPYAEIINLIDLGLKHTNKIALLGAAVAMHPDFDRICEYINNKITNGTAIEMSVSSLRADSVSKTVIETLANAQQKTATIAIEAGSERLRKVINKNLTETQIFETVETAQKYGLKGLKIYAMIGLPTETQADIDEMIDLITRLKKQYKGFNISMGFSTFVPKANTPFQFCKREDTKSLEKKYQYLQKQFHKIGIKINCSSVQWDYWQALISRGDRRLSEFLISVYNSGGNLGAFKNSYKEFQKNGVLPPSDYFATEPIDFDTQNPWDFIKSFHTKNDLIKENKRLINDTF